MKRFASRGLAAALVLASLAIAAGCDDSADDSAAASGGTSTAAQGEEPPVAPPEDAPLTPQTPLAAPPSTQPSTEPARDSAAPPLAEARDTPELKPYTQTIPGSLVEFEMVPVPGGDGMAPFYLGKHEVSWDEFAYWAFVNDVEKEIQKIQLRAKKLRPSPPYDEIDRGFGLKDRPALGMSRLSAELYCKWLSEQTGRTYRLPTKAEWQHAFKLGHGSLTPELTPEKLGEMAWYAGNSENQTHPPGTRKPDALGLCDMLGNVAEWVTDTGNDRLVLGGHFHAPADRVSGEAQEVEDESWNANYPNEPKSIWWFVDADYVGFRVVCEIGPAGPTTQPGAAATP